MEDNKNIGNEMEAYQLAMELYDGFFNTGVIEKEGHIYAPYIPVTEGTNPVLVDMFSYDEAFGTHEKARCHDYTKNYEPMRLTPQQIKEFIDKGINLKFE